MRKKKIKRSAKIIIALIILLGLLIGLYIGFNKIFNNPYKVYINVIDSIHDKMILYLDDAKESIIKLDEEDIIRESLNASLQTSIPTLEPYSKYKYGFDIIADSKNNKLEEIFTLSDYNTGKKIFDIGLYMDNNTYLMQSKYLYNQTLDLSSSLEEDEMLELFDGFNEIFDELKPEELEYLITSIKDSIIDAIDKKTLKSSLDKAEINGKKTNVLRFDYELDKQVLNDVYNSIADGILDNYELIVIISKALNIEISELEKEINDGRNSFTKADSFTISIYKKIFSNEIVKFSLITADEFEIEYFDNIINISYKKDKVKIDMSAKNTIINYTSDSTEIINLKIKNIDNNTIDLDYTINIEDYSFNGELYLKSKKKSEKSIFLEFSFSLLTKIEGEDINLRVSGDASVYVTTNMNLIDKENTIKAEDVSMDDALSIYNKGYNILKDTPFIHLYDNMFV